MSGPLNSIIRCIKAYPGLDNSIANKKIQKGVDAAVKMNSVLMDVIDQTNANDDKRITAADMHRISDVTYKTPEYFRSFLLGHGNDAGRTTGFHHVQNDGATLVFQGRNFVDTVADAIYHFGFQIRNGRYFNEDGNDNERADDVAGWLNYFLNGVNIVYGTGSKDELGSGDYSKFFAKARSETFLAGDGSDKIWSDVGNDKVYGGNGNDMSGGGFGRDRMFGESGNDSFWGDDGKDSLYGGGGVDELGGSAGGDLVDGGAGDDMVYGGDGNDALLGGDDGDTLYADNGNDRLRGGAGRDDLSGGSGNDKLFGDEGDDKLYSGDGADRLDGGAGADDIYLWENGARKDVIVFGRGDSGIAGDDVDIVEGFQSGTDKIDLSEMGPMVFRKSDYKGGGDASCYYIENGENSRLQIDHDGDRTTDMVIGFKWVDLRAGDFIFG